MVGGVVVEAELLRLEVAADSVVEVMVVVHLDMVRLVAEGLLIFSKCRIRSLTTF